MVYRKLTPASKKLALCGNNLGALGASIMPEEQSSSFK
jgi:hypothetical protein